MTGMSEIDPLLSNLLKLRDALTEPGAWAPYFNVKRPLDGGGSCIGDHILTICDHMTWADLEDCEVARYVAEAIPEQQDQVGLTLSWFNDAKGTTHEDVLRVVNEAILRRCRELGEPMFHKRQAA